MKTYVQVHVVALALLTSAVALFAVFGVVAVSDSPQNMFGWWWLGYAAILVAGTIPTSHWGPEKTDRPVFYVGVPGIWIAYGAMLLNVINGVFLMRDEPGLIVPVLVTVGMVFCLGAGTITPVRIPAEDPSDQQVTS